ncbi:MAG TPA: cystathionine gamma-synthase [Steroidobacteraceae bacterium]|nr:cystathionine gamma-synthase [Steroidobacteraceae bacterium]
MSDATKIRTRTVRAALETDSQYGAVVPPIHLSSTFAFEGYGAKRTYDYSRSGNPTRDALAAALADLEAGAGAVVTSSGMAAVGLVTQLLAPQQLVVVPHDCYGGTYRLFNALSQRGSMRVRFVDFQQPGELGAAFAEGPAMVWIETPSNPLLRIVDIGAVAKQGRDAGAIVVADNTFLSPVWQRPLELGADLVVHSTTKYLNGHSDVVGGAVIAASTEQHERLAWWANCTGVTGAPFDSFLTLRGLRSLHARMRCHAENAERVARMLERHPAVRQVYFPGLETHPGHSIAMRQQLAPGAMVSFELAGGLDAVRAFLGTVQLFSLAESLGGVESLVAHPASMTHAAMDPEARRRAGIADSLLRLSIGIEEGDDLLRDLADALDAAGHPTGA